MFREQRERFRAVFRNGSPNLFLAISINAFGAGMFFPFALLYYQAVTDLSVATIGVALTAATLVTLAAGPVAGSLVDRFGARRLVVLSQVIEAVGFIGYLTVTSAPSLFVAAMIATAGTRMFYASFSTLIAELVEGAEQDRWYGLVGVSQSVGASLSGMVASVLIGSIGVDGFRVIIVSNACCLIASAVLIGTGRTRRSGGRARQPQSPSAASYAVVLRDRVYLKVVASNGLFILCSWLPGIALAIFATEALDISLEWVAGIGFLQTGFIVVLQTRITGRMRFVPRTRSMQFAGAVWVIACAMFALALWMPRAAIVPYFIVAGLIFTVANLLYVPASRALAASLAPAKARGRYVAAFEFSYGVAAAVSPALFGLAYDLGPAVPWLAMIGVVTIAMLVLRSAEPGIPQGVNLPVGTRSRRSGSVEALSPAASSGRYPRRTWFRSRLPERSR
jgi:MFS family permease